MPPDPYAGLGTPPQSGGQAADPYAGLGTPLQQTAALAGGQPTNAFAQIANNPVVKGLSGAYTSAAMNGFGGLVARGGELLNDVGIDAYGALSKVKQMYPGQSDQFYRDKLHQVYNVAETDARQSAQQEVKDNPYPGSQVGNFAASVLGSADPTWLFNPGEGVAKTLGIKTTGTLAGRVAGNAATHAVIGSGLDDVYQGADLLTGMAKKYDIKRNLESAAMAGAFGAAHPVVSDFVTNLFSQRGIDTTPAENPQGRTTPLTGGTPTPEVAQQIHDAWLGGNEQDIFNSYKNTNITPPSHEDIHNYVTQRDNPEANPQEVPPIGEVDQRAAVQDHINNLTSGWKNAPDFEVINHIGEIEDPTTLAHAVDQHADDSNVLGFVGPDNKVRIFANKIDSPETLNSLVYHEALGHYGLQETFGNRLDSTLNTLVSRNVGQFGRDVAAWQQNNPGAYGGDRTRAAEEVLAEMSQNGQIKPVLMDAVSSFVRNIGRKMGLNLSYSDAEVRNILAMAHDSVINGKGRNVPLNGFKTNSSNYQPTDLTVNKNMTRGQLNALGKPLADSSQLDTMDRLKADPRFWSDPEYRANVLEYARTQQTQSQASNSSNLSFMNRSQLAASKDYVSDDLERIYKSLDEHYTPTTQSWDEVRRQALDLGFKPSQIKDLGPTGDLSVKLARIQAAANMADIKLAALNERLNTPQWSMADQMSYIQTLADSHYLNARVKGTRADIARALNISKAARSYSNATMDEVAARLKAEGSGLATLADDPIKFMKFANDIKELFDKGNPDAARIKIAGVDKPYWEQYLNTFHFNAMLSALSTHVKAPLDMMTGIARDSIERALSVPVGKAWNAVEYALGKDIKPGVQPAEVMSDLYGTIRGVFSTKVYQQALHAARTGEGSYVAPDQSVTTTNIANSYGSVSNPHIPVVSFPSQLISAQDTVFRSIGMSKYLYALGTRQAAADFKARGINPSLDDLMTAGAANAHNPTPKLLNDAEDQTNRALLLNRNPLNNALDKFRVYRPDMTPWERVGAFVTNNLAPFIRVESNNLINRVVQRSPLAFLDKYTQDQLSKGGPEAHIALTKILYGTTLLGLYWNAADAAKNKLTGSGPENVDKYKEEEAAGWSPRAVHEDGRYNVSNTLSLSLNPFDVHNATATMVADLRQAYEQGANHGQVGNGLKLALGSMLHELVSSSWVSDVQPGIDAATAKGPEAGSTVGRFAASEAKSWIPNIAQQANRVLVDPDQRDTNPEDPGDISGRISNSVKAAIPGLSQTLPVKYSVYGDPLPTGASVTGVHTWLSNGNGTQETTDPTKLELQRLDKISPSALVTPVLKTVKVNGETTKLTPEQFEKYQQLAGTQLVNQVDQIRQTPQWAQMSDQDKIITVKAIQSQVKKAAREQLFGN